MKIICLEEHILDPAIGQATQAAVAQRAPYMADLGSRYQDQPDAEVGDRPRLQSPKRAMELAGAPAGGRLAAMDANGIDMQVLSYSNATQTAPVGQAAELARAPNDRRRIGRPPSRPLCRIRMRPCASWSAPSPILA